MPKASTLQGNFNAGELSPLLYGRTDSPRYKQGLASCLNYIPTLQGPLQRRPGTTYLANAIDPANPPTLIPFNFSQTQAYILEFGQNSIRFYANQGQVVTSGTTYKVQGIYGSLLPYGLSQGFNFYGTRANKSPLLGESVLSSSTVSPGTALQLKSPYNASDVANIRWCQNQNVLYLFHPNYPTYKLIRYGAQYWSLYQVFFHDGPYLPLNTINTIGDATNVTVSISSISGQTATLSTQSISVSGAVTDPSGSGQIQITTSTHGYSSGQSVYITGVTGTTEANGTWTINVLSATTFLLVNSVFVNAYISGGTSSPAIFNVTPADLQRTVAIYVAGVRYWAVITFVNNASSVIVTGTDTQTFPSPGAATAWQLGVYCATNGYPACGAFYQNRLVMSGCPTQPQELDLSTLFDPTGMNTPDAGGYENFAISNPTTLAVEATNAIQFDLQSSDSNVIRWLKNTSQGLAMGTAVGEWIFSPSSQPTDAISPTDVSAVQTSAYGSANTDAVPAGTAVIYIQKAQRKVREFNFFFQAGSFRSTDVTELSEHITNPSITKIIFQKETQPLLWGIRSDGALLSMLYNRDDASVQAGWTRHFLGGQSDASGTPPIVFSMATIPSEDTTFDQVWLVVQRYINGSKVATIEYMNKISDDLVLQEDSKQFDCAGVYDSPVTITAFTNANPGVITATAHGFSNGQRIQIVGIIGMNISSTDINGNTTISNSLNYFTFLVANAMTNTFTLTDYLGNAINTTSFGAYVSGGQARALVTNITGLTWLENETVSIVADGGIHPNLKVSNSGGITLNYPAAKVQIGYSYQSQGQLLRVEGGAADGTSIGKTRRTTRAAIQVHRMGDLSIGTSFTRLIPIKFGIADNQMADQKTPLYSGIKREGLESAYDFESQICFQQSSGLPGMIVSVTSFMEEQDV